LRAEVDELFASNRDLAVILEDVARVSVRLMGPRLVVHLL
jgi:hypothetical protein